MKRTEKRWAIRWGTYGLTVFSAITTRAEVSNAYPHTCIVRVTLTWDDGRPPKRKRGKP
jgi:hypothetical protein